MRLLTNTKINHSVCLLAGLTVTLLLKCVGVSYAVGDTWIYKADIPTARTWVGGGILDGKIYVIGGATSPSSVTSTVEMYDPIDDTWTMMASMPSALCAHATCVFEGKIYVFGGVNPDVYSSAKKNVYVYDPQTDTWDQEDDMPYANAHCGIAVVNDTIYLIGGMLSVSTRPVPTVMAYDPATESWTQKADMPTTRGLLSACVVDGKIYAIGGATEDWSTFCYKQTEVYDPATDTWTRKSDMPTERFSLGTCAVNGKIYAIGGHLKNDASTTNEVYDPITDIWTTESPLQHKRLGHFLGLVEGKIYAIGGSFPNPAPTVLSTAEEYDPNPLVVDFNGDEIVDYTDMCLMIDYWGTDESLYDIAPLPFGDGIVDVKDLILLAEHLFEEIFPPELVAYWKLDEQQGDIAYNSIGDNHGILTGDPVWDPDSGQVAGALEFDGFNDSITTDFVLDPSLGAFSVFAWVKGGAPGQVIISQIDGAGIGETWLGIEPETGKLMTGLAAPSVGRFKPEPLVAESIITDGQWHHVGFVWDGSYRTVYMDGIEVAKDTVVQNPIKPADGGLYIGADKTLETGTFFSGQIDDIRIYNVALNPEKIAALAQ